METSEVDEKSQEIMLKFLQRNFPVQRIKDGRRFRRGIIIDSDFTNIPFGNFYMKPQKELFALFANLTKILRDVFGVPTSEINIVLFKYLNLM